MLLGTLVGIHTLNCISIPLDYIVLLLVLLQFLPHPLHWEKPRVGALAPPREESGEREEREERRERRERWWTGHKNTETL